MLKNNNFRADNFIENFLMHLQRTNGCLLLIFNSVNFNSFLISTLTLGFK